MNLIELPKESFENPQKPSKLFLFSFLAAMITNCVTIFGFSTLDLKVKIIICLAIVVLICFIDIIALYTQYYKYYYQAKYFNLVHALIGTNLDSVSKAMDELHKESADIRNSVEANNADIQDLKRKLL